MSRIARSLLALLCFALLWTNVPRPLLRAQVKSADHSALPPLPHTCGDGLPDACCMSGYILIDDQPVLGAKLTLVSAHGREEVFTDYALDDPDRARAPYYSVKLLNAPPLSVKPSETITITAEYSNHTRTITHTVLEGPQRVDIVLPRTGPHDYVFDAEIWKQAELGDFSFPTGIAVDGLGTVYVVDWGNDRVQVFNANGGQLGGREWGTRGSRPGLFSGPVGIALDRFGNVYIADALNYRIQKFTIKGKFVKAWGSKGAANGQFNAPFGIAVDSNGDVYVTDSFNDRIQQFNSEGEWKNTWGQSGTAPGEFDFPAGISVDNGGNIYVSDQNNNRLQKRTPDGVWQTWGTEGTGELEFRRPEGLAVDNEGFLYVADRLNARIQKITTSGQFERFWGTIGTGEDQFLGPLGVAVSGDYVYVVDTENHRVQRFDHNGNAPLNWGSKADNNGQFTAPVGVAVDKDHNLYVTEWENNRVQKFDSNGQWQTTWGKQGNQNREFDKPTGIAVDTFGNVFVADTDNHRIQKFDTNGRFLLSWDSIEFAGRSFPLVQPTGIAVDGNGDVYVVDTPASLIHKFSGEGAYRNTWGLPGDKLQLRNPIGIGVDASGQILYVVDSGNNRLVKFNAAGDVLVSWGSKGAEPGQFSDPTGLALDQSGNVYVADSGKIFDSLDTGNHRIQKFAGDGTLLSVWGSPGGDVGQFANPVGVAVDNVAVYVADARNNRVQRFHLINDAPPVATIVQATPNPVRSPNLVNLRGMGNVSSTATAIAGYEWTWSHDAITTTFALTANTTLNTADLTPGQYTVSFRVSDTQGIYSEYQSVQVTVVAPTAPVTETWAFLLFLNGDTRTIGIPGSLAPYFGRQQGGALYRLEHADLEDVPPNVQVAALFDGDSRDDSSYYLSSLGGRDLVPVPTPTPEVNMGDPQTLVDFVRWAKQHIQADHYYLAIADHGNGLAGISWDYTSTPDGTERLTNSELRQALLELRSDGNRPIDVVHLDACLLGLAENMYQLHDVAEYLIVSENEAWGFFAYDKYRATVGPLTSARAFAEQVALRYALEARSYPYTIAAIDLSQVSDVTYQTGDLAQKIDVFASALLQYILEAPEQSSVRRAAFLRLRNQVQKVDANGNIVITNDDAYIDLRHWAELLLNPESGINDEGVQHAARALVDGLVLGTNGQWAINEYHSSGSYDSLNVDLEHAYGIAIYFPPQPNNHDYRLYAHSGLLFPSDTRWDEFLAAVLDSIPVNDGAPQLGPVPPGFTDQ